MSSDLQCLYSTPVDSPEMLPSLPQQPSDSSLNRALTYVAQEVTRLLQQSYHFPVNRDDNPVKTIAIQASEPEYEFIIPVEPLTAQELEVLQLIVDGHNNSAIARKLYITGGTVRTNVRNIFNKLCVSDRTQAAIRALRCGLVH